MARITMWRPTRLGIILAVGIIVVAAIVGVGLYMLKQQGQQARREDAVKAAEQNLKDQSQQGVALNQGDTDANKNQSQSGASDQQNTSQSQANQSNTSNSNSQAPNNSSSQTGANASQLPQTGPEDTATVIAIAALSFSIAGYIQSRRQLQ